MKKQKKQFTPDELDALLARHVLDLPISEGRTRIARLVAWGILSTVGDAIRLGEEQILLYRGTGQITVTNLRRAIESLGLDFDEAYPIGPRESKARKTFSVISELGLHEEVAAKLIAEGFHTIDSLLEEKKRQSVVSALVRGLPKGERYISRGTRGEHVILETGDKRYLDLLSRIRAKKLK